MVYICSKVNSITDKELIKIDLEETPSTNVSKLYESVASKLGPNAKFNLVSYGRILEPSQSLAHYGIRDSSIVYAYQKPDIKLPSDSKPDEAEGVDPRELARISIPIKTAIHQPEFVALIEKLKESRENRENLISVTPGMREDPVAMAILQDIDLLNLCLQQENMQKVMNKYPALATAAGCLAAQYHEEHREESFFSRRGVRSGYSMDEMDDFEGPEGPEVMGNPSEAGAATAQADSTALRELLSQALMMANVSNNPQNMRTRGAVSRYAPRRDPPHQPPREITPQMLQSALQAVTANLQSQPTQPNVQPPVAPPAPAPSRPPRDWSRELEQMREMGLTDERLCIQALEATSGNVDAAVNLIFANQ